MRLIDADALLMKMNLAIAILEGTMKNLGLQDDAECQMELKAYRDIRDGIKDEPTIEPIAERETTTVTIGKTRGGQTEWYECDNCGEPVHPEDRYCSRCGRRLKVPSGDMHENHINREK